MRARVLNRICGAWSSRGNLLYLQIAGFILFIWRLEGPVQGWELLSFGRQVDECRTPSASVVVGQTKGNNLGHFFQDGVYGTLKSSRTLPVNDPDQENFPFKASVDILWNKALYLAGIKGM